MHFGESALRLKVDPVTYPLHSVVVSSTETRSLRTHVSVRASAAPAGQDESLPLRLACSCLGGICCVRQRDSGNMPCPRWHTKRGPAVRLVITSSMQPLRRTATPVSKPFEAGNPAMRIMRHSQPRSPYAVQQHLCRKPPATHAADAGNPAPPCARPSHPLRPTQPNRPYKGAISKR